MNRLIMKILEKCPFLIEYLVMRDERVYRDFCTWVSFHPAVYEKSRLRAGLEILLLNFKYLFFPFAYRKEPYLKGSESALDFRESPEEFAQKLLAYDIISFDVFDTLLFRVFDTPKAVFDLAGERLSFPGFRTIRVQTEREVSALRGKACKYTLEEIWQRLEQKTGIPADKGLQTELQAEMDSCFANPYMKRVIDELKRQGKHFIAVSDMYLHAEEVSALLEANGLTGFERVFLSSEQHAAKSDGTLFRIVKDAYPGEKIVHIGDNALSDIAMAEKCGIPGLKCANVNTEGKRFRAEGMTPLFGSLYSGLVNAHLHNGLHRFPVPYEYGFICGGFYIYGFCRWIHEKAKREGYDKVLFIARDGDILQRVFSRYFPDVPSEYFLWSRLITLKYVSNGSIRPLLDLMVRKRLNDTVPYTVSDVLESLDAAFLSAELPEDLKPEDMLSRSNAEQLYSFLESRKDELFARFADGKEALKAYVSSVIGNAGKIILVDVGWTGSCPRGVRSFIHEELSSAVEITTLLAAYSRKGIEENLLVSQDVHAYLFSEEFNTNLREGQMKAVVNTLLFEMFTDSKNACLSGFRKEKDTPFIPVYYPVQTQNNAILEEIASGILDFAELYHKKTEPFPFLRNIPGRDAFLPFAFYRDHKGYFRTYFSDYILESIPGPKQTNGEISRRM